MAEPKTLAIVGAGPGLGSALARRFAQEGWSVVLVALRQDVIDAGLAELERFGVNTFGAQADVTDRLAIERAFGSIVDALGVPDVVVYNASIYQAEPALELSHEALRLASTSTSSAHSTQPSAQSQRCSGPSMECSCSR